jgi:hypothetical protein
MDDIDMMNGYIHTVLSLSCFRGLTNASSPQ